MNRLKHLSLWILPVAIAMISMPSLSARDSSKTIYVTFLDDKGTPITDFKPGEIHVAENGKEVDVTSYKIATSPMSIMLLGDSTKAAGGGGFNAASATSAGELIRDIRAGFSEFSKDLLAGSPESEIGLMEFGQASILITPYTSKIEDIEKGITRLFPKPNADSVLLEAITEAAKDLGKRKNTRRAMISINVEPGTELSKEPPNNIMNQLGKAQAALFSVSLQKGENRNQSRGLVLPTVAKQTGGRHEIIVGQSALVSKLKETAGFLLSQYEITYTRPSGPTPGRLQLGVTRPGVTIYASQFPPQ
jgi:hypothetical protein